MLRAETDGAVMDIPHIDERAEMEITHIDERAETECAVVESAVTHIDERAGTEGAVMDITHIDEQGANDDGMGITGLAVCPLCGTKLYRLPEVLGHDCRTTWY